MVLVLAAVVVAMAAGCRTKTDSSFEVLQGGGGAAGAPAIEIRASWSYRSGDVDVDVGLGTTRQGSRCESTGRVMINKIGSPLRRHYTDPIPCEKLELSTEGDILLYQQPTGHDWSDEELSVNRDREVLSLGPWHPPEDESRSYRFELSEPDCGSCTCPRLVRRTEIGNALLELGRNCD